MRSVSAVPRRAVRRPILSTMVLCLSLTACGGGGGGNAASAADAKLAALLPADCLAVLRVASIDALDREMQTFAAATRQGGRKESVRDMLGMVPMIGDASKVDGSRSIVLAMSGKRGTPPNIVALLPATDPDAYAKSLPAQMASIAGDGYVALALQGKYQKADAASPLMRDLPATTFALRADIVGLTDALGAMIGMGLGGLKAMVAANEAEPNAEEAAELVTDLARTVLESGEAMTLGFDMTEGKWDFSLRFMAKPDSALDGWASAPIDTTALSNGLTGTGSVEVLMTMDVAHLWPRLDEPLARIVELQPESYRAGLTATVQLWRQMQSKLGNTFAMQGDMFGEHGMSVDILTNGEPGTDMITAMREMMQSPAMEQMGIKAALMESTPGDAGRALDLTLSIDADKLAATMESNASKSARSSKMIEQMFGKEVGYSVRASDSRCALAMGRNSAERAQSALTRSSGSCSPALQQALAQVRDCNPMVVERLDMAAMMRGAASMTPGMPALPADAHSDVMVYAGVRDREWRFGMTMDIVGMMRMFVPR